LEPWRKNRIPVLPTLGLHDTDLMPITEQIGNLPPARAGQGWVGWRIGP
jgi:hypothetical protein